MAQNRVAPAMRILDTTRYPCALPAELIPRKRCIDYTNRTAISVKHFFEKVFSEFAEAAHSSRNAAGERKRSPCPDKPDANSA